MHQSHYCKQMSMSKLSLDMDHFRHARAFLAWLTHTKPDLSCLVKKSAQITASTLSVEQIIALSKVIQNALSNSRGVLQYPPLTYK